MTQEREQGLEIFGEVYREAAAKGVSAYIASSLFRCHADEAGSSKETDDACDGAREGYRR